MGKGDTNPDDTSTPVSVLVDIHYAKLGVQGAWNRERVLRLCGWLQLTRYELASLIMLPHKQMDKYMAKDIFPGPAALLLSILENHLMSGVLQDAIPEDPDEPIIPSHLIHHGATKETT